MQGPGRGSSVVREASDGSQWFTGAAQQQPESSSLDRTWSQTLRELEDNDKQQLHDRRVSCKSLSCACAHLQHGCNSSAAQAFEPATVQARW